MILVTIAHRWDGDDSNRTKADKMICDSRFFRIQIQNAVITVVKGVVVRDDAGNSSSHHMRNKKKKLKKHHEIRVVREKTLARHKYKPWGITMRS